MSHNGEGTSERHDGVSDPTPSTQEPLGTVGPLLEPSPPPPTACPQYRPHHSHLAQPESCQVKCSIYGSFSLFMRNLWC